MGREKDKPRRRLPASGRATPIKPVNTSRGLPLDSSPKASVVPHDPPMYFPADLWPQTNMILIKAQRNFPLQTQAPDLCRHIVAGMTPIFVEAVKAARMKAGAVLRTQGGGMEDLLYALLVRNDPDNAYRVGQEVRRSEEWLRLSEAIAEVQGVNAGATQVERPHAQPNAKTSQGAEGKSTGTECWTDIEITFLSDERVEISSSAGRRTYNYAELGFEDRRNHTPNRAWITLREMATHRGAPMARPAPGKGLAMFQKRMEEIRKRLRQHLKIQADPIPFNGADYQVSFKLSCGQSFES